MRWTGLRLLLVIVMVLVAILQSRSNCRNNNTPEQRWRNYEQVRRLWSRAKPLASSGKEMKVPSNKIQGLLRGAM